MLGSRFDLAEALNTIAAARDAAVAAAEEDIALEQAALAIAHEKRRYFFFHQLLGHRVLVRVEADKQNAYVFGSIHELIEGRGQPLAHVAVFGGKLGKYLEEADELSHSIEDVLLVFWMTEYGD